MKRLGLLIRVLLCSSVSLATTLEVAGNLVQLAPTQNIWVAVRTDGVPGSGTQADPYDGSTPVKFDAVLSNYYWIYNLGVHLVGPGPFRTSVGHRWAIRPGWVLSGDGMYSTTLQLVGNVSGIHNGITCVSSDPSISTDYATIENLTVDCNWPQLSTTADTGAGGEKNISVSAIALWGSNNLIDHVRAINGYGSWANQRELFLIDLVAPRSANGTNDVIQFCRSEMPWGNYGNPFALAGWANTTPSYLITTSKVVSCTAVGVNDGLRMGFTSGGVNLSYIKDCQVDGNTFIDCWGAAYQDTGSVDGLQVTNNTVTRGWMGVGLCSSVFPKQNITISGNNFSIQNRSAGGGSYGIFASYGATANLTIDNNTIAFDTSGGGMLQFWGIAASLLNTATISTNTIGVVTVGQGVINTASGSGLTMFNNMTPSGTLIPALNNTVGPVTIDFEITSIVNGGGGAQISFTAVSGNTYRLEYKNALADAVWTQLTDYVVYSSGPVQLTDLSATGQPHRFYHVLLISGP